MFIKDKTFIKFTKFSVKKLLWLSFILVMVIIMGRIVPKYIKTIGDEFFENNKEVVKANFEANKQLLNKIGKFGSKKVRNVLAGYLTRLAKKYKE